MPTTTVEAPVVRELDANDPTPKAPKLDVDPKDEVGVTAFPLNDGSVAPPKPPKVLVVPLPLPKAPVSDPKVGLPPLLKAEDVPNGEDELEVLKAVFPPEPKRDVPPLPNADAPPPELEPKADEPNVGPAAGAEGAAAAGVSSFFSSFLGGPKLDPNENPTGFPIEPDVGAPDDPKPPNVGVVAALPNALPNTDLGASPPDFGDVFSSSPLAFFAGDVGKLPNAEPPNAEPDEDPNALLPNTEGLNGGGLGGEEGTAAAAVLAPLGLSCDNSFDSGWGASAGFGIDPNSGTGAAGRGTAFLFSSSLFLDSTLASPIVSSLVSVLGGVNFGKEGGSNFGKDGVVLPRGVKTSADVFNTGVEVPELVGETGKLFPPNENPPLGGGGARVGLVLFAASSAD